MKDIKIETHGLFKTPSKGPIGVIVHTTGGRSLAGDTDARNTLKDMAERGLGAIVISRTGRFYPAHPLNLVTKHAGRSSYESYSRLSNYCLGIELCNAGLLNDQRVSWFGEKYDPLETHEFMGRVGNIKPGIYHAVTNAQIASLIDICATLAKFMHGFDIDMVLGHDEVAPGRKSDPGGSLGMPMERFRNKIRSHLS